MAEHTDDVEIETTPGEDVLAAATARETVPSEEATTTAAVTEPAPAQAKGPTAPTPAPSPVEPAKKWAGRFETPEELERQYQDTQRLLSERTDAVARLERLLGESLAPRPTAPVPTRPAVPPADVQAAKTTILEETQKLALGDDSADPEKLAAAYVTLGLADPARRKALVDEASAQARTAYQAERQREQDTERLRASFFEKHPDLKGVPMEDLKVLSELTADRLARDPATARLSDAEFIERLFADVATGARRLLAPGTIPAAPTKPAPASSPTAAFSEAPGTRPAAPKELDEQQKELAEIFDRR